MKAAHIYVAAVLVSCPHCKCLQPVDGVSDDTAALAWPLSAFAAAKDWRPPIACLACGQDFRLPALRATVPLTPADRP